VLDWLLEFFPAYANIWPASIRGIIKTHPGICQARYNIAPTQPVLVVRQFAEDSQPQLEAMRWGLVPPWADSLKIAYSMINARCETLEEKPTYKHLLDQGRCVLLADGYYEWKQMLGPGASAKQQAANKQTYWIHRPESRPLALACLWTSNHKALEGGPNPEPLLSTTIITTDAGVDTRSVHDRMPVVLQDEKAVSRWLSETAHWQSVKELLGPASTGTLQPTRVSSKANSVRNQGPELIRQELHTPELF
jgi:putative SOS response-associated peptidase YedK